LSAVLPDATPSDHPKAVEFTGLTTVAQTPTKPLTPSRETHLPAADQTRPVIPPIASRFVAGESAAGVIDHARSLDDRNVGTICNLLGEHYDDPADARDDVAAYESLVDDLAPLDCDVCISVKPTQLGLDVSVETFQRNLAQVVDHAAANDVFVWIDMEDHATTQDTLDAFVDRTTAHDGGVGLCLQSNMRRTREDLERVADLPGKIRLVKGAYDPPKELAYQSSQRVNEAYREDLAFMFEQFDDGIAVGSHDPVMIEHAKALHDEHGTPYEIQMLMGVREDAQTELAREVPVYQYTPFGDKWLSYFYRRVMERKSNALFALRAILKG